jgi:predicted nucleotidyltransferase component of viral defense system
MIKPETYTIEWIKTIAKTNRNADPILVEKVIRALTLLYHLAANGLDFVFKGGTSLMLILDTPKRLSIDIDIILNDGKANLSDHFNKIIADSNFIRYEEQERKVSSSIEKAHFKFFYIPEYKTNKDEEYILLDILFEANHYPILSRYPIQSPFLQLAEAPLLVTAPTAEGLLGDKLTAFAPATTGIPYEKHGESMSMEIIKQLYDIAHLFDKAINIDIVKQSFTTIAGVELQYRNHADKSISDVHEDTYQTALTISSKGLFGTGNYTALQTGIQRVARFIFAESFQLDKATFSHQEFMPSAPARPVSPLLFS